jgi:hypothetical protein
MRWPLVLLAVFLASVASATPTKTGRVGAAARALSGAGAGACVGCGSSGGGGGGASVQIPAANATDSNCPTTLLGHPSAFSTTNNYIEGTRTCPTGANAAGYDVTQVSIWITPTTGAGVHMRCSVYTDANPHVKVASGCDTVEWTSPASGLDVYISLATTGACHLATATRYWIACSSDGAGVTYGTDTAVTLHYQAITYSTTPLPTPWTPTNLSNGQAAYLTATSLP